MPVIRQAMPPRGPVSLSWLCWLLCDSESKAGDFTDTRGLCVAVTIDACKCVLKLCHRESQGIPVYFSFAGISESYRLKVKSVHTLLALSFLFKPEK